MNASAREKILGAIREATRAQGVDPGRDLAHIARDYVCSSTAGSAQLLQLLTERLHDYDAQVLACGPAEVTASISQMLTARALRRIVVPAGFSCCSLPAGFDFVVDEPALTHAELDRCEGVLTESTLAIAETGSIVLQGVPGQGRRALSLIPDYHLCVVRAAHVVATVPEGVARLAPTATLPTTFLSGPSATADIEMTRIKGVHGPRSLDVLLIHP